MYWSFSPFFVAFNVCCTHYIIVFAFKFFSYLYFWILYTTFIAIFHYSLPFQWEFVKSAHFIGALFFLIRLFFHRKITCPHCSHLSAHFVFSSYDALMCWKVCICVCLFFVNSRFSTAFNRASALIWFFDRIEKSLFEAPKQNNIY